MAYELAHLAVFHAIAGEGGITRAAEKLGISQPAVSKQLKSLERSLGLRLVERQGRGIQLTAQGTLLSEYARRIFNLVDEAEASMNDLNRLRRGRLGIGAGTTIGVYVLPD